MAKDMTQGNLVRILIGFSVPLILSGLLQQLYNWADAFIVGNIEGELALAAIGATGTILFWQDISEKWSLRMRKHFPGVPCFCCI